MAPEVTPDEQATLVAYHGEVKDEMLRRAEGRDKYNNWAVLLAGGAAIYGVVQPVIMLAASLLVAYFGYQWYRHDVRIGRGAAYLRDVLDPAMKRPEGVPAWEDYLDSNVADRKFGRIHLSAVMAVIFYPLLQAGLIWYAVHRYSQAGVELFGASTMSRLVTGFVLLDAAIAVLTLCVVRHKRVEPPKPTGPHITVRVASSRRR